MTKIEIQPDKSVKATWNGKKGGGNLFQISAECNVTYVNALSLGELAAVQYSAKNAPFPLGKGEEIYREVLGWVKDHPESLANIDLGEARKAMVIRAGEGFNAPYDSYLRIAFDIATNKTPVHSY